MKGFQSLLQKCSKGQRSFHFLATGKSRASNFSFCSCSVSHIGHRNEGAPGQDGSKHSHLASEEVSEDWLQRLVPLSSRSKDTPFQHPKPPSQQPTALCCPLTGCKQRSSNTSARPDPAAGEAINSTEGLERPCHHQLDLWRAAGTAQPQPLL